MSKRRRGSRQRSSAATRRRRASSPEPLLPVRLVTQYSGICNGEDDNLASVPSPRSFSATGVPAENASAAGDGMSSESSVASESSEETDESESEFEDEDELEDDSPPGLCPPLLRPYEDEDDSDDESSAESSDSEDESPKSSSTDLQDLEDMLFLQRATANMRKEAWGHVRLDWDHHVKQLQHEGLFENEYGMSLSAHRKLVDILSPSLQRAEYNSRSPEPIKVEHIVAAGLRFLGGGRVKDQRHLIGCSRKAAYVAVDDFIDAVNSAPELDISFPTTVEEWNDVNAGWTRKSTDELLYGCVGALDGFFQRTNKPSKKAVSNVLAYYSGHYESYGVNCQACVTSDLQFSYFGVVSPGSTNDNISYPLADGLKDVIEKLPLGLYMVGDAAYTLTEHLLVPFTGADRLDPAQDAFNYFLSQLRIRVEMAFGRLVNKFRILSGKVLGSLNRVSAILTACARLHNFIIREDCPSLPLATSVEEEARRHEIKAHPSAPLGMSYLPVVPDEEFEVYPGVSHTREAIVDQLREPGAPRRPPHNIERKKRELGVVTSEKAGLSVDREFVSPM